MTLPLLLPLFGDITLIGTGGSRSRATAWKAAIWTAHEETGVSPVTAASGSQSFLTSTAAHKTIWVSSKYFIGSPLEKTSNLLIHYAIFLQGWNTAFPIVSDICRLWTASGPS